ncbi:MAG: acyl-CoA dehydrogenase family protein [Acidimicrobiales bacterium]
MKVPRCPSINDETHELFRDRLRSFVERPMLPHSTNGRPTASWTDPSMPRPAPAPIVGMAIPEQYGGGGTGLPIQRCHQ